MFKCFKLRLFEVGHATIVVDYERAMLTIPIFRPWRSLWDRHLADAMRQLDELAKQRQNGRQTPPLMQDCADVQLVLRALHWAGGRVSSSEFVKHKIEPLLKASVWPRWLLLEAALDHAANLGDLHLSALILRSQIEELDALRTAATVLACPEGGAWDGDVMAEAIRVLLNRVLPRLQIKNGAQLIEQASDAGMAATRPESLQRVFDRLSEYVHPNYGSHALSVRPQCIEVAEVFAEAFIAIYEAFLCLPWANDGDDSCQEPTPSVPEDSQDPFLILADKTIPTLKLAFPTAGEEAWVNVAECFRQCADSENAWSFSSDFPTDVEAVGALRAHSVSSDSWPEALRTVAGQNRYAFLVAQEQQLARDASLLLVGAGSCDGKERLSVLVSGLNFAINLTEYKLSSLACQASRLINSENVLGAALAVRSMLEHHAVAIELGKKLGVLWERAEKHAPNAQKVAEAFGEAEKQLARVLAGSSEPSGVPSTWRALWRETVRKPYNVLGPVNALDAIQPGCLKTYGFLSHITHGTVGTGGDLLGAGGAGWRADHRPLAAQLVHFLANMCDFDAMLDRQAGSMTITHRLDIIRRDPGLAGERIKTMRLLHGQKLKSGRDIFGAGTESDPYRFRDGLLYHDAYREYLAQECISVRNRTLVQLGGAFGDRVDAEDGRVLYFLNDQPHLH